MIQLNKNKYILLTDQQIKTDVDIDWSQFKYVAIICYTQYNSRISRLNAELDRINLSKNIHYHWDIKSVFKDVLLKNCNTTKWNALNNCFFIGYNNYKAIKTAYQLGFENILVLEDDVRFLKNKQKINECIKALPQNFDLAMFDSSKPRTLSLENYNNIHIQNKINNYWCKFSYLTSSGCYAMSRRCMERFIAAYEEPIISKSKELDTNDYYFNKNILGNDLNFYCSYPNAAIQISIESEKSHCNLSNYHSSLNSIGININNYYLDSDQKNFISRIYSYLDRDIQKTHTCFLKNQKAYGSICKLHPIVNSAINTIKFSTKYIDDYDYTFIWGFNSGNENLIASSKCLNPKTKLLLCEDGFIRSVETWMNKTVDKKYTNSCSLVFDSNGFYYDATRITDIEKMLLKSKKLSLKELNRTKKIIDFILFNKLSKYNHQPRILPNWLKTANKKFTLVVDQSYGDCSISQGLANDSTFKKMLDCAINENPTNTILIKTHPDTLSKTTSRPIGYYSSVHETQKIKKINFEINPYTLFECIDNVYVCSSQLGFEALLAGKKVKTFGMPFYAGWGVTDDYLTLSRRNKKLSIFEIFYNFYIKYTKWINLKTGLPCNIETALKVLLELRSEYENTIKNDE